MRLTDKQRRSSFCTTLLPLVPRFAEPRAYSRRSHPIQLSFFFTLFTPPRRRLGQVRGAAVVGCGRMGRDVHDIGADRRLVQQRPGTQGLSTGLSALDDRVADRLCHNVQAEGDHLNTTIMYSTTNARHVVRF